jgi:hypothetical protein
MTFYDVASTIRQSLDDGADGSNDEAATAAALEEDEELAEMFALMDAQARGEAGGGVQNNECNAQWKRGGPVI